MRRPSHLALGLLAAVACGHEQFAAPLRSAAAVPMVREEADTPAPRPVREPTAPDRTSLLEGLDTFLLRVDYRPDTSERMLLALAVRRDDASLHVPSTAVLISREEARRIVDCLARSGFLYRGSVNREKLLALRPPCFTVAAGTETDQYFEHVPLTSEPYAWHGTTVPPILVQLRGLRSACEADAAQAIDDAMAKVRAELALRASGSSRPEAEEPSD